MNAEVGTIHWVLMGVGGIFSLMLAVIGFFAVRTLRQVDQNQTELYHRLTIVEKDFYVHRGMCSVMHGRRFDDPPTSDFTKERSGDT